MRRYTWLGVGLASLSLAAYFGVALTVGFHGPAAHWVAYGEVPVAGPVAQPISYWTDLGFILAGILVLRRLDAPRGRGWMQRPSVYAVGLGLIIVWMGPASMLEHGTLMTNWGWCDASSIHWYGLWVIGYLLTRGIGGLARPGVFLIAQVAAWLGVGAYTWGHEEGRQRVTLIILTLTILAVPPSLIWPRRRFPPAAWAWFGAILATFGAAGVFLVGGAQGGWAAPWGHGVWHLLSAVAMYLSFRMLECDQ